MEKYNVKIVVSMPVSYTIEAESFDEAENLATDKLWADYGATVADNIDYTEIEVIE